jgi:hypothetical protein
MIRSGDRQFRLRNQRRLNPEKSANVWLELFDGCHRQICECSHVSDHIQQVAQSLGQLSLAKSDSPALDKK